MIEYARTVRRHGRPVRLYNVFLESGGVAFEVAFEVTLEVAEQLVLAAQIADNARVHQATGARLARLLAGR
jgi:hypothetical protein